MCGLAGGVEGGEGLGEGGGDGAVGEAAVVGGREEVDCVAAGVVVDGGRVIRPLTSSMRAWRGSLGAVAEFVGEGGVGGEVVPWGRVGREGTSRRRRMGCGGELWVTVDTRDSGWLGFAGFAAGVVGFAAGVLIEVAMELSNAVSQSGRGVVVDWAGFAAGIGGCAARLMSTGVAMTRGGRGVDRVGFAAGLVSPETSITQGLGL